MSAEDLLDHYKLKAEIFHDHTIHTSYQRNHQRGTREKVETKWDRQDRIGDGAFGKVWKESCQLPGGTSVVRAVKEVDKHRMEQCKIDFKKELLALAKFAKDEYRQTELFVSFYSWFEDKYAVYIAMEYFEHGDLARHIQSISSADQIKQITTDLLEGLKIMHSEGFAHRDLKPQNIFVVECPPQSARFWCKIGDFGISKRVRNEDTSLRTQIGTPHYQAPEIAGFIEEHKDSSSYGNAVDLWSLGCIVYHLAAKRVPFARRLEVYDFCHDRLELPELHPESCMDDEAIGFIKRLLAPLPSQRLPAESALKDPWILSDSAILSIEPPPTLHKLPNLWAVTPNVQKKHVALDQKTHSNTHRTEPDLDTDTIKEQATSKVHIVKTDPEEAAHLEPNPFFSLFWTSGSKIQTTLSQITIIAVSSNGKLLASGSRDSGTILWDAETGRMLYWLSDGLSRVSALSFSPDSDFLATRYENGHSFVNHVEGGRPTHIDTRSTPGASCVHSTRGSTAFAFSPDSSVIAIASIAASGRRCIDFISTRTDKLSARFSTQTQLVRCMAFAQDGRSLAFASNLNQIDIWINLEPRNLLDERGKALRPIRRKLKCKEDLQKIKALNFLQDSVFVLAALNDGKVIVWNVADQSMISQTEGCYNKFRDILISPDKTLMVWLTSGGRLILQDQSEDITEPHALTPTGQQYITAAAFCPWDTSILALGLDNKTIRLAHIVPPGAWPRFELLQSQDSLQAAAFQKSPLRVIKKAQKPTERAREPWSVKRKALYI